MTVTGEDIPTGTPDQIGRIQQALAAFTGSVVIPDDQDPLQGHIPNSRLTRITEALVVISDNLPHLQHYDSTDETMHVELTHEQRSLVSDSMPLLNHIAKRLAVELENAVDVADLISAGYFGLVDAATRFDPTKSKFTTFAYYRIRGEMLDYCRAQDYSPRSVRSLHRRIIETEQRLAARSGCTPSDREIAEALEVPTSSVVDCRNKVLTGNILYLEQKVSTRDGLKRSVTDSIPDGAVIDPESQFMAKEDIRILREAMSLLPETQRHVIEAYEYEGRTMLEIGISLGVTESRISQIHKEALNKLASLIRQRS